MEEEKLLDVTERHVVSGRYAQMDGKWRIVPRGEAWSALGAPALADEDLDRFQEIALVSERDPKFDLLERRTICCQCSWNGTHVPHALEGNGGNTCLIGSRSQR